MYMCRFRDDQYVGTQGDSVLQFQQAKLEHGGRYHCRMTNPQGGFVLSNTVTLTVGTSYVHVYIVYMKYGYSTCTVSEL